MIKCLSLGMLKPFKKAQPNQGITLYRKGFSHPQLNAGVVLYLKFYT